MNEKIKLSLLITLALSLFFGHESLINFNLSNSIYNPFYSILPFFILFYLIIKLELVLLNSRVKETFLKPMIISAALFVGIMTLAIIYGFTINFKGLGNFSSHAEKGNYIYIFMTTAFLASSLFLMIFNIFYTNCKLKKQKINKLKNIIVISLVLFGLNYILTYIFLFLYNVLTLIVGFSTGG